MTVRENLNLPDDQTTILAPIYVGMKQRFLLNWVRDHSTMKTNAVKGRNLAREIIGDFYNTRKTSESGKGQYGYAFPSISSLVQITQWGETSVKKDIKQMRDSGEWLIVSGFGGRPFSAGNKRTERTMGQNNRYFPLIPWDQMPQGMTVIFEEQIIDKKYAVLPEWATPATYETWLATGEVVSGEVAEITDTQATSETIVLDHAPVEVHYLTNADLDELPPIEAYEPPRDEDDEETEDEVAPAPEASPVAVVVAPALPESLTTLLSEDELQEMATASTREIEAVVVRVQEIESQGASLALTLQNSRSRQATNGPRTLPLARWLPAFGLRFPRRPENTANMGAFAGIATEDSFAASQMKPQYESSYSQDEVGF